MPAPIDGVSGGACGCPKLCRGWSGGVPVFVDESVTSGGFDDSKLGWFSAGAGLRVVSERRSLIEGAVWPVGVVMVDVVGDEAFELSLVPDDGAVEELAAQRPNPAFGECVGDRCVDWGLQDLEPFGSEDVVESVDELAASVSNELTLVRSGAGSIPLFLRILQMVDAPMS